MEWQRMQWGESHGGGAGQRNHPGSGVKGECRWCNDDEEEKDEKEEEEEEADRRRRK